ncbi:MAG: VWA domain-containing protein [Planctomycetes bacterium]|nr:VWA domain-containing protein [Planctomycetota bacterium]MCB9872300.1 VWA domain-containing protein [Planctomycetota bacterium]
MSFAQRWMSVWPPPRRELTIYSYATLVLFLIGFPLGCWIADRAGLWVFSSLWPFGLLVLAPWLWRMHRGGYSGLPKVRAELALLSRFALLALFILVFAQPRTVRTDKRLSVMFAIDYSHSIVTAAADRAIEFALKRAQEKPELDLAGLLFFGRNASVESPPGLSLPESGTVNVHIERDGTDIAKALSLAAAMLPPQTQSRIVLISDGVATDGALSSVLDDLKSRDIPVDVLGIDYQFEREVWLERLDLPRFVKLGEPFEASVVLSSLQAGSGVLTLAQNGEPIARQPVTFHAGKNRFTLPVHLKSSGYYEYTARIELPKGEDSWAHNNQVVSFLYLQGKGRVLLVTDAAGDPRDWRDLERALREGQREVQRISNFDFPRHALALLPHDCIVFVNVPRDAFDEAQLQAAHDAVYNQGSGFVMVGGPNSYGPGGYHHTKIEDLLPVTMDVRKRKQLPKGALAIILHTCEFANGNTWGKNITKRAIDVLDDRDEVGVLAYSYPDGDNWLFPLVAAGNREKLAVQINNAQLGDMPSFVPTMQMALQGLKASDAAARHMIIISDGDPTPPPPGLLQQMVAAQIRVSTVGINPHTPNDVQSLQLIAQTTGGKFYFPKDPNELPEIFIKEAKTLRRSAIQNITFTPEILSPSPILKGITGLPKLDGYVWTTPRPRAATILDGPSKEDPDPVLAHWRYGVGASIAFTSDLSPRWGKHWLGWDHFAAFVKQMITEVARADAKNTAQVRSYAAGGQGHIVVDNYDPAATFLSVAAQVEGPDKSNQRLQLRQTAPNRYEASFPLHGTGRYQVTAVGVDPNNKSRFRAHGGFAVSYSPEFLRFRADRITLERIRERTGGRMLAGAETGREIFGVDRRPRHSSRSILDLLLLLLACWIPLDVGLRRVQLDWATLRAMVWGKQHSTQTLSTLLEKKGERTRRADDAEPAPGAPKRQVSAARPGGDEAPAAVRPTESPSAPAQPPAGTTTSRLLEAKRRAQEKKP